PQWILVASDETMPVGCPSEMVIFTGQVEGEVDGVVADGLWKEYRVGFEKVAACIDEIDDLQQRGFADQVLRLVCAFNNVQPGMQVNDRA
ncbi:hypothetical protein ABER14_12175, partial [Cutibacterium acnes]